MRWTSAAVDRLCAMLADGLTYAEIGESLGCSTNSVSGRISRIRDGDRDRLPPALRWADPAKRNHRRAKSHNFVQKIEDLPPRVNRDPCFNCGVRRDVGCAHTAWELAA